VAGYLAMPKPLQGEVARQSGMAGSPLRRAPASVPQPPLTEREIESIQHELDRIPAPLEPLDVSMLDGYLCGVLLQPQTIAPARWWPHVVDVEGRAAPAAHDLGRLQTLVLRRHAELEAAIERRDWFDPWVFELDDEVDGEDPGGIAAVYPWVAGFATALDLFPGLMQGDPLRLTEPLALLYRHLHPDDLEDADDLLEEIETLEPAADLSEAVEELVRATLLLADITRPRRTAGTAPRRRRPAPR